MKKNDYFIDVSAYQAADLRGTCASAGTNKTIIKVSLSRESIDGTIKTYIYTRATFKPWAIRKSGVWKSLDNPTGRFSIRSKGQWIDKSEDSLADVGKVSKGHNRIRKNNQFKQQGKLGS